MEVKLWQVWHVWFPYRDDPNQGKRRPVVVERLIDDGKSVVLYVTSKTGRPGTVPLRDWREEGLSVASAVNCSRHLIVPVSALEDYAGDLTEHDVLEIKLRQMRCETIVPFDV